MEFISELSLFALKALIIVAAIVTVLIFAFQIGGGRGAKHRAPLDIEKVNHRFRSFRRQLQKHLLSSKSFKSLVKDEKKVDKTETEPKSTRLFVLDFMGDIRASAVTGLREEITAILSVAKPGDEVIVRLESGGGLVTSYGLAASQLARLKPHHVRLTICVDKIAASGGYMMACVADRILAAPFAVVGSIGVIAQVPNFNRLLKKADIDYREITAGEFKRTISVFGEITEPGMEKFKSQIEATHDLFKRFVAENRPQMNIAAVATGEHWYGTQAIELGLVDQLQTSDDYIASKIDVADVFQIRYQGKKRLTERLSESFGDALHSVVVRIWSDFDKTRFGS